MTSPVTKAMIESYALMVMVMGTFFVYFCGMVWAFCNPKVSGEDEDRGTEKRTVGDRDRCWMCEQSPPKRDSRCAFAHPPAPPYSPETITQTTYVNFEGDADTSLSDCTAFCLDDLGINNQIGESRLWIA